MEGTSPGTGERGGARLDADAIVEAVLTMTRSREAGAMTMRRLGAELGADPTAVYRHFRSKSELMAAVLERLFAQLIAEHERTGDWQGDIRALSLAAHRLYCEHPALVEALAAHPEDSPSLVDDAETGLSMLREAGLTDADAALAWHSLVELIAGSGVLAGVAAGEITPERRAALRRAYAALPVETNPNCVELAPYLYPPMQDVIEFAVDLMLDGIKARAERAAAQDATGPEGPEEGTDT